MWPACAWPYKRDMAQTGGNGSLCVPAQSKTLVDGFFAGVKKVILSHQAQANHTFPKKTRLPGTKVDIDCEAMGRAPHRPEKKKRPTRGSCCFFTDELDIALRAAVPYENAVYLCLVTRNPSPTTSAGAPRRDLVWPGTHEQHFSQKCLSRA